MSKFDDAFEIIVGSEGGYSNDPNDPGGATRFGITEAVARANGYEGDMKDLPLDKAKSIYKAKYWDAVSGDNLYVLDETQGVVVEQIIRPTGLIDPEVEIRPIRGQVDNLLNEIRIRAEKNERVLVTTLTKRMSEDLSEHYTEAGVKCAYMHSEVSTLDRVKILRDLRRGNYDVLIGVNLLREGLDLPEVSLVAILDADKEGFLRSERSLIQTIGRAARNISGKAILYADRMTDSMKKAIDETERRRAKQIAHNALHGITPKGVFKQVRDLIDGVYSEKAGKEAQEREIEKARIEDMSERDIAKEIKRLEKLMMEHARNLEFENAARVRDQLALLRSQAFGGAGHDNVMV